MPNEKGIRACIYKGYHGDCSNGGISSRCNVVTVLGCPDGQIFNSSPEEPAVTLVRRIIGGKTIVHAEPVDKPKGKLCMFGGCYIGTSDSRLGAATGIYGAIALHDRFE